MRPLVLLVVTVLWALSFAAAADKESGNTPVVRSSENGYYYARSVPSAFYGTEGKTRIYRVGAEEDTLVCEYDWYARGMSMGSDGRRITLVRFGPWHRGSKSSSDHLAIGLYRDGETVREYSTSDLEEMSSGISRSFSHYTVIQERIGFRQLENHKQIYRVKGVSGKLFSFDLDTGLVISADPEPADTDDDKEEKKGK